jgi:membrane associated rhomboid family serine protease
MKRRSVPTETAPVTALLVVACLAVYGLERVGNGAAICAAYGLVPARPTAVTALSALFVHDPASWWHVVGNMAFLVGLGPIVERALGSRRFAVLYVAAGLAGAGLHLLLAGGSTTPMVGASGAIFGVLAAAALLRPRLVGFAIGFVGLNIWQALHGTSGGVAVGAHLGGFAMGFLVVRGLFARRFEKVNRKRKTP